MNKERRFILMIVLCAAYSFAPFFFTVMEKEGFVRCVNLLQDHFNVDIRLISTDRHPMIRKEMRVNPNFNHIIHQFDPWHVAKGISKKLIQASKKKGI